MSPKFFLFFVLRFFMSGVKGKMTRSSPVPRAPTFEAVPIPAPVLAHHCNETLCADFFFVQGICFLHTISREIGFRTVQYVPNRTHKTILREPTAAVALDHTRGLPFAMFMQTMSLSASAPTSFPL